MADISSIYTSTNLKTRWDEEVLKQPPYLGDAFFQPKKQLEIEISQLQGNVPVPRTLQLSAPDTKVIPLPREAFSKVLYEIPFFKNSYNLNEKQKRQLNLVLATQNETYIRPVVDSIYNDTLNLVKDASVTREMANMMVLTSGNIIYESNGQAVSYDYGVKNKVEADWSVATTADPINDIEKLLDTVEQTSGVRPTRLLMNSTTLNTLRNIDSVKNKIYILGQGKLTPSKSDVVKFIQSELDVMIILYNKMYKNTETGEMTKFVPDNVISVFPEGYLGDGVFATTPEEDDLMSGATDAVVSVVDTGVAITVTKQTDPVMISTKVSMFYLPVLYSANTLGIMTIKTE